MQKMSGSRDTAYLALDRGDWGTAFPMFRRYPKGTMSCAWNVTLAHSNNDPPQRRAESRLIKWIMDRDQCGIPLGDGTASAQYWTAIGYDIEDEDYIQWLRSAAENNDAIEWADVLARSVAAYRLGLRFLRRDDAEAVQWHRRAAEGGEDCAENDLGDMYAKGRHGVPRNDVEAVKWFRYAAEQNNDTAQTNLGTMYFLGRGVLQDHTEAANWYRRAAEQSNDTAQAYLGTMYADGLGVPQDDEEAAEWFRRVAETERSLRAWSEMM